MKYKVIGHNKTTNKKEIVFAFDNQCKMSKMM